jgi:hypothetical protein
MFVLGFFTGQRALDCLSYDVEGMDHLR